MNSRLYFRQKKHGPSLKKGIELPLYMTLDCPHCSTKNSAFNVVAASSQKLEEVFFETEAAGLCGSCRKMVIGTFYTKGRYGVEGAHEFSSYEGSLTGEFTVIHSSAHGTLVNQTPKIEGPDVPEHLPAIIERPFLEAEKTFTDGHWNAAAALYRKAVDRAITPLIGEVKGNPMLGKKLGLLEQQGLLPDAMLDWIRVVKDDGNFALHDDDSDFDTRAELEPAREFARTLLTYLYTLPKKVELARGKTGAANAQAAE